jgi:Domain of unknown function (DUF4917)
MPRIISFQQALAETAGTRRHLLLGNGFSIALFPDRFRYGALLEQADFSELPEARKAFDLLGTTDFEIVVEALTRAVQLLPLYSADDAALQKMAAHAESLKEILVRAIAGRHPERPSEITEAQYKACRIFLANFVGLSRVIQVGGKERDLRAKIYSLNYDLLLYWTLLHDQVVNWNAEDPVNSVVEETEELEHDDGFRAPDDDPDASYVTWDAEGLASDNQNIHFLHGALHLFDYGAELQKRCWERAGGIALIDQIREALGEGKFPLFVSEGNSAGKLERIRHSGYLQRSLKSFARICGPKNATLFIFGHSLAENDAHVIRKIERGRIGKLYISFHGDAASDTNIAMFAKVQAMVDSRDQNSPLEVAFFDADTANVWG